MKTFDEAVLETTSLRCNFEVFEANNKEIHKDVLNNEHIQYKLDQITLLLTLQVGPKFVREALTLMLEIGIHIGIEMEANK